MFKKLICLVSVLVLSVACTSYADYVIGDFEDGFDDWTGAWAGTEDLGNSTIGATLNSQSMSVKVDTSEFWKLQLITQLNLADGATAIEADITFIASEWPDPNSWLNVNKLAIQDHTNWIWQEVFLSGMTVTKISGADLPEPDADGNIAWWEPAMGDATWTISWSLDGKTLTNDEYTVFLSLQNPYIAKEIAGFIYIDNIKVVGIGSPPPTKIVYVDATDGEGGNTMLATGEVFTPVDVGSAGSGSDGLWRIRGGFSNGSTIYEAGGDWAGGNTEDCPRLMTSVDVPEGDYEVYAYMWTAGDAQWRMAASLENSASELPLYLCNDPNGEATLAVAEDFEKPVPILIEEDRTLWQVYLGTTGTTTAIIVYVDDDNARLEEGGNGNDRTWYDGIGYKVAPPPKPKVIWITDAGPDGAIIDRDGDGLQDDQQWIDWLVAKGYKVDAQPGYWMSIEGKNADDVNDYVGELNTADLVILSRAASSGDYDDGNEPTLWNSVTAPMISLSAWHLRNNRWLWINSSDVQISNISFMRVVDRDHPIFADVEINVDDMVEPVDPEVYGADLGYKGTCFVNSLDMGNGRLLALSIANMAWIAEWEAGVEFYDGAGQFAGGPRLMFAAGTQDEAGKVPQGAWNLTAAGEQMFNNAVEYMISLKPVPIEVENAGLELPGI